MEQATAAQIIEIVEIRARHDRNRLLGTYDPARDVLRLFHRGETVTVSLEALRFSVNPIDVRKNVE